MIPLPAAIALIAVAAVAGWNVGGIVSTRRAAFEWTAASVAVETKGEHGK